MKRALTKRLWLFAVTCLTVQALAQSTTQSLPNQPRPQQKGSVAAYATPKLGSATGAIPCEGRLKVLSFRAILSRAQTGSSFEYGGQSHEKTVSFVPSCIARSGTPVRQRVRCRSGSECWNAGGQAVALV